jgi:hypothetical protein
MFQLIGGHIAQFPTLGKMEIGETETCSNEITVVNDIRFFVNWKNNNLHKTLKLFQVTYMPLINIWIYSYMQSVTGRCEKILGTSSTHQNRKNSNMNMCPETFNLWVIAERMLYRRQQQFSINVGRDCWWLFGRPACFATSAYRQPLPRFPLTWSAKANGRCTSGSQSTNVVHARWCSGTF